MKKFLLAACFLSIMAFIGYSQSLVLHDSVAGQLANNATINKTGVTNTGDIIKYMGVKNNTASSVNVLVKKSYINVLPETVNVFCWGICFGPDTFISPEPISIDPGITNFTDFSGHYNPSAVSGISTIRYTFLIEGNPNDSICFNVNFAAYPLGLDEIGKKTTLTNAFPNPAGNTVSMNYSIPVAGSENSVIIRNVLGVVVKLEPVVNTSGKVTFYVNDLSDGIYFYSMIVEGKTILTKKLIIKH